MESYELVNGEIYDLLHFTDGCAVARNGNIVYSGSYGECRRYIEGMREIEKLKRL